MEGDSLFRYHMKEVLTIYEMGMKEYMKNVFIKCFKMRFTRSRGNNSREVFKAKT